MKAEEGGALGHCDTVMHGQSCERHVGLVEMMRVQICESGESARSRDGNGDVSSQEHLGNNSNDDLCSSRTWLDSTRVALWVHLDG